MYSDVFDKTVWSFSRLSTYEQCPYQFYLNYLNVDEDGSPLYEKENNIYGLYGSYCHTILESVLSHKQTLDEAIAYYADNYDDALFCDKRSEKVKNDYFLKGLEYLDNFNTADLYGTDIVKGVEKKVRFDLDCKTPMVGIIDLLVERENGAYCIIDHKSAKSPIGKRGGVLASHAEKFKSYKRQLYLYAKAVMEQFGEVETLRWNFFNDRIVYSIPFVKAEYYETIDWAKDTIATIKKDKAFEAKPDYYYCHNICEYRSSCEYLIDSFAERAESKSKNELHIDSSPQRFKQWSYQYR